ncbi:flagellar filament capping protein FliD [Sphingobium sp. H39-3-25]|uniref:flagellar filament capping protein FliD n=1 Tax=Sphingobium arseniciresistens TaxID=3030834 RepID=UPI0023B98AF2|nr:flagellar filament capping protein FliD [Sphingobium arseniciresistens]
MTSISSGITTALGISSGVDSAALVSQLVAATRDPKEAVITSRQTTNNTRISALASARSSLDTFSEALTSLLSGTGFSGTPASNDPTIVAVSTLPGGTPTGLPAQVEVQQLASAQTLKSTALASSATAVGLGTLTLTAGGTSYPVEITAANNTLDGLAAAINGKNAGVTATVVTDVNGSRLVMKGASGAANGFTLTRGGSDTADTDLQRFTFDGTSGGMTRTSVAANSKIVVDGVDMEFASNTVDTAIPYVRLDLNKVAMGTDVTIASSEPTTTMRDLVTEFVSAYNTLRTALNNATAAGTDAASAGALAGDSGVREMMRQLSKISSTQLVGSGTYKTLVDIGVKTNRDGTLAVDTTRLDAAIAADPAAVTQLLNPSSKSDTNLGIDGVVKKIRDTLEADDGPLASSKAKFEKLQTSLADQLEKLDTDMENYEARLSTVYAAMDKQLAALKATQSYMDQQIAAWNNSGN